MNFVVRLLVTAAVIFGIAFLSAGWLLEVEDFASAVLAAAVLAVLNAFVRPVLGLISLPITILSLGLFALVLNALMIYLLAWIVPGVETTGFIPTILAAILISAVSSFFADAFEKD